MSAAAEQISAAATTPGTSEFNWVVIDFLVALAALAGSLYMSLGMKLIACPLCLYQRTFVMGVVGVLGVGMLAKMRPFTNLALLALPLAVSGFGVGIFHEYLEYIGKLECPAGIAGAGSAPQQAVVIQGVLVLLLLGDVGRGRGLPALLGGVFLGAVFALAAVRSAPPAPQPTGPYPGPVMGCRPPYHAPE